MLSLRVAI